MISSNNNLIFANMKRITTCNWLFNRALQTVFLSLLCVFPASLFAQVEISTAQGLKDIANNLSGSYKLTADIVLTDVWTPIGNTSTPFTGIIDGNGHVIKGLTTTATDQSNVGLIGAGLNATIKNLGLVDVDINGSQNVGSFFGRAQASQVLACYSSGIVQGNDHVAGIIGGTYTTTTAVKSLIKDCYSTAEIKSRTYQAAGILGTSADIDVENVFFAGSVTVGAATNAGGIVALIDGGTSTLGAAANTITNSVAVGPFITCAGTARRIIGNPSTGTLITVSNNYAYDEMLVNGVSVDPMNDTYYGANLYQGENKTAAELKVASFYTDELSWSTDTWNVANGSLPTLKWQAIPADVDQILGLPTADVKIANGASYAATFYSAFGEALTVTVANEAVVKYENGAFVSQGSGATTVTVSTSGSSLVSPVSKTFTIKVISTDGTISSADDLDNMRLQLDGVYTLQNDIVLTSAWVPVGDATTPFTGTLNGNGHIIKGLTYNSTATNKVGLFGVTSGATISKLGIEDANIVGNADAGAIVGSATNGTQISECYVANSYVEGRDHVGAIVGGLNSSSTITNSYSTAVIYSRQYQAGGIAGIINLGTVDKCFFSGLVSIASGASNAGGITSLLDGGDEESNIVSNSVVMAPYIMGTTTNRIMGTANGNGYTLFNNYGLVSVREGKTTSALAGVSSADADYGTDGLEGADVSTTDIKGSDFYSSTLGWDMANVWFLSGTDNIYPILKWQQKPVEVSILGLPEDMTIKKGASVSVKAYGSMGQAVTYSTAQENIVSPWPEYDPETEEILYVLYNTDDAARGLGVATIVAQSEATANVKAASASFDINVVDPASLRKTINTVQDLVNMKNDLMADYVLTASLDLSSIANWAPIGSAAAPFTGSFDGNGYKLSNLKVDASTTSKVGLFGYAQGATFKNIALENVNVVGYQDAGGLIGKGVNVNITQSYVTGYVEGNDHVGSLVGGIYSGSTSTISNCYSPATIVTRNYQAGGLLGVASSTTIDKSYFSGSVQSTASELSWQMNTGGLIGLTEDENVIISNTVSAASSVIGGTAHPYVARGSAATITNCFYRADMTLSYVETVFDITTDDAKTVSSLQQQGTYTGLGWDFTNIWAIASGKYPTFQKVGLYGTGVNNPQTSDKYVAYIADGQLNIKGISSASVVSVYTVSGALVNQARVYSSATGITLPAKGIYLVRVQNTENPSVLKVVY